MEGWNKKYVLRRTFRTSQEETGRPERPWGGGELGVGEKDGINGARKTKKKTD